MDKEQQLIFLEDILSRGIQEYLMNEVILRAARTRQLAVPKGKLEDLQKAENNKAELERKFRYIRDLIKEIKDGTLVI